MFSIKASFIAATFVTILLCCSSASAQYIYVANAGEDTVSKIDINLNQEVARYATWFTSGANHVVHPTNPWAGPAPSRLLEDSAGNLYVLNRFFSPPHLPVLLKIAPSGGIPNITTSTGSTVLAMTDTNSNNHIDLPSEATDVRIKWASEIGTAGSIGSGGDEGALGRALCMDPSGVLWVGMFSTQRYYKVDSVTGQMLAPLTGIPTPGHSPYGCQVASDGQLWSVDESQTLAEINTTTNQVTIHNHAAFGQNYAVSVFNGCGTGQTRVYLSNPTGKTYIVYNPQTSSFSLAPLPAAQLFPALAVGVDPSGDIFSGKQSGAGPIIKSHPNGVVVWETGTLPAGPAVFATDLRGLIVDKQKNVWAVHLRENEVVKYSGVDGHYIATVPVGLLPYTYGNPPPPTCPCTAVSENPIACEGSTNGIATYSWSFLFTNHSPFATPATAIDISSAQVTSITPAHFQFTNPVPVNGQATVSGTFTVANPVTGSQVCLDIRLNAGAGWCCPMDQVCFQLPECQGCAKLQGQFICQHGTPVLSLSITNQGPSASQSVAISSNTPGVTVAPLVTTQTFPPNTPVTIPLTITGATPGQTISLSVSLTGPIDPKTGFNTWCCTSTITVTYPKKLCPVVLDGWIFNDLDRDGLRDSEDTGLVGWTATLTDAKGISRTGISDAGGGYSFENVEQGTYRLAVRPLNGWRPTLPEGGSVTVTVGETPPRKFDFGFVKAGQ